MRLLVDVQGEIKSWSRLVGLDDSKTTYEDILIAVVNTIQDYCSKAATREACTAINGVLRHTREETTVVAGLTEMQLNLWFNRLLAKQYTAHFKDYADFRDHDILQVLRDTEFRCELMWAIIAEWLPRGSSRTSVFCRYFRRLHSCCLSS